MYESQALTCIIVCWKFLTSDCTCNSVNQLLLYCPVGLSLAQPCQNLAIIRLDTYSDVAHSIVLLNDNNSDPSPSFRCQSHLSSIGSLVWLPSPETEYFSVLRELQNITQIYLGRYEQQILGDLVVSAHGQQEGFYLCTNVFSFGCYLGVFQRISLGMHTYSTTHSTIVAFII